MSASAERRKDKKKEPHWATPVLHPAMMASVGHTDVQLPQSMHLSGSIQRISFFSLMAVTGHSLSHAPQLMHASVTLYAISILLRVDGQDNTTQSKSCEDQKKPQSASIRVNESCPWRLDEPMD